MESKIGKTAKFGATASVRAAEMIVKMAQGKARVAVEQVKRVRKKVKAAKKDFKLVKKMARQAKKSLKTAQSALNIARTQIVKEGSRKKEPVSASTRPAGVRPQSKAETTHSGRKRSLRKVTNREDAPHPQPVCAQPPERVPPVPAADVHVRVAPSPASEPNEARP
jgi:hypothetical protein